MLQLGTSATSTDMVAKSIRILETILLILLCRRAADNVTSDCFERWSKSDTFRNTVVEKTVFRSITMWPIAVFIKQRVSAPIT